MKQDIRYVLKAYNIVMRFSDPTEQEKEQGTFNALNYIQAQDSCKEFSDNLKYIGTSRNKISGLVKVHQDTIRELEKTIGFTIAQMVERGDSLGINLNKK